jgi:hypothetical protein
MIFRYVRVLKSTKKLFDFFFSGKVSIVLQLLHALAFIINDVEVVFDNTFVIPKMLETASESSE